ncbi:MAG: phosphatidylserine decarboxylase family protein [Sedimentisphaerales bacterium]|nr:phosphatidylserine decarboxylase family protein [Sedimentisphaerales bacterium]
MKIPITKYGLPQVVIYPGLCIVAMIILDFFYVLALPGAKAIAVVLWIMEAILVIIILWILSFFRDPDRKVPAGDHLLVSPADGKITDIEEVDEPDFIGGKAKRIGIFLSIFDVHINRTPCAVKFEKITYHKGRFTNAMHPESGRVNESNDIAMTRLAEPKDKLLVRQISGAIARRIVCDAKEGQEFAGGAVFGMIKFGSRTELYLPAQSNARIIVKIGDKVKAGLTILAEYDRT